MFENLENTLLFTLVSTLTEDKVDSAVVNKAMELICNAISFDCGVIYEKNYSNNFCITEQYLSCCNESHKCYSTGNITLEDQCYLVQKELFYIEKTDNNTPLELHLLKIHNAESLVLLPIIDDGLQMHGFVSLFNVSQKPSLCQSDLKILSVLLRVLLRYTERQLYQKIINQGKMRLEKVLDNAGIDIYVNDFYNHDILYVNRTMAAPYGGKEEFAGQKCWQVLFPNQNGPCEFCPEKKLIDENGMPTKVYSWDYQRSFDGAWFRVFSSAFYWEDDRLAHIVSSADITENKRNEAIIENLANYDQLTQLPNRRMLLAECERRIDNASSSEKGYILFFDIDGFKAINDTLGHDAGDEFLIKLGEFFSGIPLMKDSIYRNGGDEFVAVIGGESITKSHIKDLARFIHARFEKPWELKNGNIYCNTSIGVACYPEDGISAGVLIQKADQSMYKVKKSGGGGLYFGYQLNAEEKLGDNNNEDN